MHNDTRIYRPDTRGLAIVLALIAAGVIQANFRWPLTRDAVIYLVIGLAGFYLLYVYKHYYTYFLIEERRGVKSFVSVNGVSTHRIPIPDILEIRKSTALVPDIAIYYPKEGIVMSMRLGQGLFGLKVLAKLIDDLCSDNQEINLDEKAGKIRRQYKV
jgi:hypothetical protein